MSARHTRSPASRLTNCKHGARNRVNRVRCRHCLLLYAGACPLPAARSVHVMEIHCGSCGHAVVHPKFMKLYPEKRENARRSLRNGEALRHTGKADAEGPRKCSRRRKAM